MPSVFKVLFVEVNHFFGSIYNEDFVLRHYEWNCSPDFFSQHAFFCQIGRLLIFLCGYFFVNFVSCHFVESVHQFSYDVLRVLYVFSNFCK